MNDHLQLSPYSKTASQAKQVSFSTLAEDITLRHELRVTRIKHT